MATKTKTKASAAKGSAKKKGSSRMAAAKKPGKMRSQPLSLRKLGYAIVFVRDMNRGVKFYRDTLGVPLRFDSPEWTEFEMEGFTLALHRADVMPKNLDQAAVTELCFDTADVRGARADLVARGVKASELHAVCELPGGVGASASFRDPDGNHLSIFGFVPKSEWTGPDECC
jgi:lactoylglutathione lyase